AKQSGQCKTRSSAEGAAVAESWRLGYYTFMVSTVLTAPVEPTSAELLRPEPLADGTEPEQRIVICGISWKRYLAFDKALGDERPGPQLYYLEGQVEIMTTSNEHERVKEWMGGFLEDYFLENGIESMPR